MDTKDKKYLDILICLLVVICLSFLYYISVNTVFSSRVLPNSSLADQNISLYTEEDLDKYFSETVEPNLPEVLDVYMDHFYFQVPVENLNIQLDKNYILSYGKSPSISETLVKGISIVAGQSFDERLKLSVQAILDAYPYGFNTFDSAFVKDNGEIKNCEYNNYKIELNYPLLEYLAADALLHGKSLQTTVEDIAIEPDETKIIYYCDIYRNDISKIKNTFNTLGVQNLDPGKVFGLYKTQNGLFWGISNRALLSEKLHEYKNVVDVRPQASVIEYVDGKALVLKDSKDGKLLDINQTITNIEAWLGNINSQPNFDFEEVKSNSYLGNREVLDFTQKIATGTTRLDEIRNGAWNWVVPIAQAGVEELNNTIVYPGQEFSFIGHVKPRKDNILVMESGRPLGGGTCNSTTTLFRAVLEAGLPITERHSHTFYVDSYAWGNYPMNIVDATYYFQPNVDLKFVNDFAYPILLKSRVYKDGEGYQYHAIDIYTSSKAVDRTVNLTNWKQFNILTPRKFTGSFDRIVTENGKLLHADTFTSKYGDPVRYN